MTICIGGGVQNCCRTRFKYDSLTQVKTLWESDPQTVEQACQVIGQRRRTIPPQPSIFAAPGRAGQLSAELTNGNGTLSEASPHIT